MTEHAEQTAGDASRAADSPLSERSITTVEAERHARQAARALDQWSRIARVDALVILQAETPVTLPAETTRTERPSTGGPR